MRVPTVCHIKEDYDILEEDTAGVDFPNELYKHQRKY